METKQVVINLIGGPGIGKTILASDIFSRLKRNGITCSIASEYVKDVLMRKAMKEFECQLKLFSEQHFILFSLTNEVDVIITDAPLLLFPSYDKTKCPHLKALVLKEYNQYDNLLYFIERDLNVPYETVGRYQDLDGAKQVDDELKQFLFENDMSYETITGIGPDSLEIIFKDIKTRLNK